VRLLVTGGAGYIGSVVTAQLLDQRHAVHVVDDLSSGFRSAVPPGATLTVCPIGHAEAVLRQTRVDAILHFAAKSLVGESVLDPTVYWETNLVGTLRLLQAARTCGVSRFVFSSTAATYGQPARSPITEAEVPNPINPYGQSKLAVDHVLAAEARAYGLAAVSLRYFNVGGALGPYGERHQPETHLIPTVLAVAAGRTRHFEVFGTDYPTSDGTAVRDYLHVDDLGRAHLAALDAAVPGQHRVYNLGTGTGYSVGEVLSVCRDVTGHAIPARITDRRPGDPVELVASAQRIRSELGWQPLLGLERTVADAWTFMRRQDAA